MNRFVPDNSHVSPSGTALVCTEALSEPAPGSVSAKLVTISPLAILGSQSRLLLRRAGHHQALAADPDIGAEHRAEGRRGPPEFERDPHLLRHGETEPAIFLRDGKPEQPHLPHLADDLVGDLVLLRDLFLERPQPLGDEPPDGVEQCFEGFGVEGHHGAW